MEYISVEEARQRSGLRLVLTAGGPGPWSEAAKGFFYVKGVAFTPVEQVPGGENRALREWTGQTLAPVAVFDDDAPRVALSEILWLAERLQSKPALIPDDAEERVRMFGLMREISGENGLGWGRRWLMLGENLERQPPGKGRDWTLRFAGKFRFQEEVLPWARSRSLQILEALAAQWRDQQDRGREFLLGDALSALDIAWAVFAAMFAPLPEEVCRMDRGLRRMYTSGDPEILALMEGGLLAHRERIYREHLGLPLDF